MKLIVAGCRYYHDQAAIWREIDQFAETHRGDPLEIVSGMCKGPDLIGRDWAIERHHAYAEFPAHWDRFPKAAGGIRNKQMADYADKALLFWDAESRGTKNMIDAMRRVNKPVTVVWVEPHE